MDFRQRNDILNIIDRVERFLVKGDESDTRAYLQQLLKQGDGNILTWFAIKNNRLNIAKLLLENGTNPNIADDDGMTPLHIMTVRNNIEGVELLLAFNANPDLALEKTRETSLWTASRHAFNLVADKLLMAGANPNLKNIDGWTPLMLATYMQNHELACLLLQFNANPNIAKKNDGNTPIFFSMVDNNHDLTTKLLNAGARLDIKNLNGETPEEFVIRSKEKEVPIKFTKKSLHIDFYLASKPITERTTKFGGQPVWLQKPTWPRSKANRKLMKFICQVKIEKDIFPNSVGEMAYIFMTDKDDREERFFGSTHLAEGGENAVIIQPGKIPSFIDVVSTPAGPHLDPEYAVNLTAIAEPFRSVSEFEKFIQLNTQEEQDKICQFFGKTKIGGTPVYLQDEKLPEGKGWQTLLQINSNDVPSYINFGYRGTAYIYINNEGTEGRMLWQGG